jgi:thymidine phosphorylase
MTNTVAALSALRSAHPGDQQLDAVIDAFRTGAPDDAVAELATILGSSGNTLSPSEAETTDVASTGGPASLSTLLSPLYCNAAGWAVRKITVPGRPAGSVDVFSGVNGYRADLDPDEAADVLTACGFVQLLAGERWAPLDARLFARRQDRGAQQVQALVIASILAKKVAAGLACFALDIRVGPDGNFGSSSAEAQENGERLTAVAGLLGVAARCSVAADRSVPQPYIGRGEALLALDMIASGATPGPWLERHVQQCAELASLAMGISATIPPGAVRHVLQDHLRAQGAAEGAWERALSRVRSHRVVEVVAQVDGFVFADVAGIRDAITAAQRAEVSPSLRFPDPCGVILRRHPGDRVARGDLLATVRTARGHGTVASTLRAAIMARDEEH